MHHEHQQLLPSEHWMDEAQGVRIMSISSSYRVNIWMDEAQGVRIMSISSFYGVNIWMDEEHQQLLPSEHLDGWMDEAQGMRIMSISSSYRVNIWPVEGQGVRVMGSSSGRLRTKACAS